MPRLSTACAASLAALGIFLSPLTQAANVALRGASTCAIWSKERAQERAQYEKAWLSGYFSGLAMGTDVNFWGTKGRDEIEGDAVWTWMDSYCAANPKSSLVTAAEKLFLERLRVVGQ
ncbi:MAG: hypothetical protein AMJ64_10405 [Betaproteobacteria bacterium SG8_39]|nr:MAG: hypothetical protein AMJ64_10405 [Betaproteobacteria bacterium SG8_39]